MSDIAGASPASSPSPAPHDPPSSEGATGTVPKLVEAVHALSLAASSDEVIAILKEAACALTRGDGASVVLRDGDWAYFAADDALGPSWRGRRFPVSAYLSGWVMRRRQAAVVPEAVLDPRVPHELYRGTYVQSLAVVPIRAERPMGTLGVYWRERRRATATVIRWLQPLADASALALELLRVRREASEALHEGRRVRAEYLKLLKGSRPGPGGAARRCVVTRRLELSGRWLEPEEYLRRRFGVAVVPGLSPEGRETTEAARAADDQAQRAARSAETLVDLAGVETEPQPPATAEGA
jgi:hypothetical protein